ncbi:MAG: FkbM family methyltransferase [Rhodospirillales bacterium]
MATNGFGTRLAKGGAVLLLILAAGGIGGVVGFRAGESSVLYHLVGEIIDPEDRLPDVVDYAVGRTTSYALYGQDLWLLNHVYPGVSDGFFVDLGSADGEADSNTKLLEVHGWHGICIDPFPSHMENRTCRMVKAVVDSEAGRTVHFQQPGQFSGGILDYAGWWVDAKSRGKTVELTTTTLADILREANAPAFINYMSVDIEGAEYEALRNFPFDQYRIGAMSVEHNEMQDRRMAIRHLLESHGYRLERAVLDQDWYVLDDRAATADNAALSKSASPR